MRALLLAGLLAGGALSFAIALPHDGLAGLLDLQAQRLAAPPEIRLERPADGEGVGARVVLAGEARSAEARVIDVQYRVDGDRWTSIPDILRGEAATPFAVDLALPPGDHLLEVRAWDGEAYSLAAHALVRRGAPTVAIVEPADGEGVASGEVTVRGVVVGAARGVLVEAGERRVDATLLPGGAWSATLPLEDGLHTIRATARADTPSLPALVTVAAAPRPPASLAIATPREGAAFGETGERACVGGCILFAGTSRNAARVEVALDGLPAGNATLLPTGAWSFRLPILRVASGPHVATFTPEGGVPREVLFLARTPTALAVSGDLEARPTSTPLRLAVEGPGADDAEWRLGERTVATGREALVYLRTPGDHALEVRTPLPDGRAATTTVPLHALNRAPSVHLAEPALVGASIRLAAVATDPDGSVVSYAWEFGDNTTATTGVPHVAHRYAQRGLHVANVTAVDDRGATARATAVVLVENVLPLANFSWEPAEPSVLDVVQFRDESRDLDGDLVSRAWRLGEATSDNATPSHRFATRGPHAVTLSVVDDSGAEATFAAVVQVRNLPPVARFSWDPPVPRAHEEVLFMDRSSDPDGPLAIRAWTFPDGTTAEGPGAVHTFREPGLHHVTLAIVDDMGAAANVTLPLRVSDSEPRVSAVLHEPERPAAQQEVRFRVHASDREGSVVALAWDFGDGATSELAEPVHRYPRSGAYAGSVTAYDEAGLATTFPFLVEVDNALPSGTIALARGGFAAFPSTLVANATDPDGRIALYRFDPDGDGDADCETTEPTCLFTYETTGAHLARVWIEDDEGAIVEAQTLVDVLAPPSHLAPPTVRIEAPTAGATLRADHLVRGDVQGLRPVAKVELQLRHDDWSYSGTADPWRLAQGTAVWSTMLDTRGFADGRYELVVRATDVEGGQGFARVDVWIHNGPRPSDVTLQLPSLPDEIDAPLELRGSAFHPQGVTSVRWRLDEGGWRYIGTSPLAFAIPLDADALPPGEHRLEVEAYRGPTEKAVLQHTFRVPDRAPVLLVDEPPAPVAHGLLHAAGRVHGAGHAEWRLDHDVWRPLHGNGTWNLTHETQKIRGGPHTLDLRAVSPDGKHASRVHSYRVDVVNPPFFADDPRAPSPPPITLDVPAGGAWAGVAAALAGAVAAGRRRT